MKFYCYLWQREVDNRPWASIYEKKEVAEKDPFRVSDILEIELIVKEMVKVTAPETP